MTTVKNLGAAKPDSKVFKRGYTVNLSNTKPAEKKPAEKQPAEKPGKKVAL
jgi:hypothetical protein